MSDLGPPSGYLFERLDSTKHSRENFSCGEPDLDSFLQKQASQSQGKSISATHVLLAAGDEANHIIGFITLVTANMPLSQWPMKKPTNKPEMPAILIARMAVDSRYQNAKLGRFLLLSAFNFASQVDQISGCHVIIVDAKNDKAREFYIKHGFEPLPTNEQRLIMPLSKAKKLLDHFLNSE